MQKQRQVKRKYDLVNFILRLGSMLRATAPGFINKYGRFASAMLLILAVATGSVKGDILTSPNYTLEPNVANSFGGFSETGSYQLLDSGGEAAIGLGGSGSYKLGSGYVSQLQQSIELNLLPEGLEAYYPLNTGLGIQAYDAGTENNHGVLINDPSWVSGKVGDSALEFTGSEYVAIPDAILQDAPMTLSSWVNIATSGINHTAVSIVNDSGSSTDQYKFALHVLSDNTASCVVRSDAQILNVISDATLDLSEWHFLVATIEKSGSTYTCKVYVDGVLDASGSNPITMPAMTGSYIGAMAREDGSITGFTEGIVDEVKVYDKVLSDDEVLDEYIANQKGIPNSLTLPKIGPGSSQSIGLNAIVLTDAPGYDLGISQDGNLRTQQSEEIPPISSSITFPDPWNEGSTVGLGFTILDAVQRDSKWGTSPNFEYAAVPGNTTTFHSRVGLSGGVKESTWLQFRLGVDGAQTAGIYRNRMGFTATIKP